MKPKITQLSLLLGMTLITSGSLFAATQKYISDTFEVTLRSGTSSANSILRMLKSGEAVTVLEEDEGGEYSLVEARGKQGYVLNRYLVDTPSARVRLSQLQTKMANEQETRQRLEAQIREMKAEALVAQSAIQDLETIQIASEAELSRVRNAAENTLIIIEKNQKLEARVNELTQQNSGLSEENSTLKDYSNMDWFVRGAGVSLIAFVLGIIITRIRWRKQDSWGSY